MARAKQVTMTTIAQPDIIGMPVTLPANREQFSIASTLLNVEQNINKEGLYLAKLNGFKKGLMQDLLTGKVRVVNCTT